jgi:hypothetical protein
MLSDLCGQVLRTAKSPDHQMTVAPYLGAIAPAALLRRSGEVRLVRRTTFLNGEIG